MSERLAMSARPEQMTGVADLTLRATAYGFPGENVDGMDPVAVRLAMAHSLEIMRGGAGPTLIEADVYRFYHHTGGSRGSERILRTVRSLASPAHARYQEVSLAVR